MEVQREEGMGSLPDIDELSSVLRKESMWFMGIGIIADALNDLNHFLKGADAKSVEKLMTDFVGSWLERTEAEAEAVEAARKVDEDCLLELSRSLQEPRITSFLSRASQRFGKEKAQTSELGVGEISEIASVLDRPRGKPFYSYLSEYIDSAAKDVRTWVMNGTPVRSVLSMVGPSGVGKTTLARNVYESETVRDDFSCWSWVDVSGSCKVKDVLKVMIKQMAGEGIQDESLDGMRTVELIGTLQQSLQEKRYMFVFDDVCHREFWNVLKHALPDNRNGSRIIVTTTSDGIANSCREHSFDRVYKLQQLSETMSWELFRSIAFLDEPDVRCPTELEPLSREIIGMCRGFPLPIVAMAGLMAKKEKRASEWVELRNNCRLEFGLSLRPPAVTQVLALSFHDLPHHLKPCFLYFSVFPEDSLIPNDKLFKLWTAEEFVEEKFGKTQEEVAEEYLNELIRRDLVQPCQGFYGLDQVCKVNRLMHNVARVKADKLNFNSVWDTKYSRGGRTCPRLSLHNIANVSNIENCRQASSLFLFNAPSISFSCMTTLCRNCEFLTLLDAENTSIECLPEELGNLVHLKYLGLKNTSVSELPKSIHKLQNLESLNLTNTLVRELPREINNLENLRHLSASVNVKRSRGDSNRGVRIKGIKGLKNLQTLAAVDADRSGIGIVRELENLQRLRRLGISGLTSKVTSFLGACIDGFRNLESLTLQAKSNQEYLNLHNISSGPPLLKHLVLKGKLKKLPDWIFRLQSLATLCLSLTALTEDPLKRLSHLPNLVSLRLYRAYEGDQQLHFKQGGFATLKLLVLRELRGLNVLEIDHGALPHLEMLRIGSAPLLNEVPSGIQYLRNLKVLVSYDMPQEFVRSMDRVEGLDSWKIEHIHCLLFLSRIQGSHCYHFEQHDSDFSENHNLTGLMQLIHDLELSFCESDEEEEEDNDDADRSSFSSAQTSLSSGYYTDDYEE